MNDLGVPLGRIRDAREQLAGRLHRTPMLSSATAAPVVRAATRAEVAGGRVYRKAEHLQKTGSVKPRAALTRIASLDARERAARAITLSAGNAGQACVWAGREAGVPVIVVMPAAAVASTVAAGRGYGATVMLTGEHVGEALAHREVIRAERGLAFVRPYDDSEVPIGNGSLGLAAAISRIRPAVRIFGVEPRTSDAMAIAPERTKQVLEPAGAAALGALRTGAVPVRHGDRVCVILSGGNVAIERLGELLAAATPLEIPA